MLFTYIVFEIDPDTLLWSQRECFLGVTLINGLHKTLSLFPTGSCFGQHLVELVIDPEERREDEEQTIYHIHLERLIIVGATARRV